MDVARRHALYCSLIVAAVPRILSQLDRDPFSSTYGSFDREYWAWATKDFSNTDLQRAVYALAVAYTTPFAGNRWRGLPRLLHWITAGFDFLCRIQHRNGSFDHHYPNEFSFVGVAFPVFEAAEAFRLLDQAGEVPEGKRAEWTEMMVRGANFLCARDELHGFISNHRAGAACALRAVHRITGTERYMDRATELIESVRGQASSGEGWINEYGGADPGYQTLATHFLANYLQFEPPDSPLFEKLVAPSVRFLQYFVHPDGSIGGEYGSRNCPLYFPAGFELLADRLPEAESIAAAGATAIADGHTPALADTDIRNFVPLLSSYALALRATMARESNPSVDLPFRRRFERHWPDAGLYVRSDVAHYTIVGTSKGGVVKSWAKATGELAASHAGYMLQDVRGRRFSTQFLIGAPTSGANDCVGEETPLQSGRVLRFRQRFYSVVHERTASQFRFLAFRLFTFTVGRNVTLADWVKRNIITGVFIHRRRPTRAAVQRAISFAASGFEITDEFSGLLPARVASLRAGDIFATIYMASAKYYRTQEGLEDVLSGEELRDAVADGRHVLRYGFRNGALQRLTSENAET